LITASPPRPASSPEAAPTPSATTLWSSGTETVNAPAGSITIQASHFFSEEDCGCAAFPGEVDPSMVPGI
jgi:hypothetical protein